MPLSSTHRSQAGAVAARTLLALFVIFGLVVFFLPTSPLGSQGANAQTSPTPSSTGPRIAFINPSGATANAAGSGPGREVSSMNDDGNGYHLVAWVANMPSGATAEFKYSASGSTDETPIGFGTLRGTDTFDIFWNQIPADGAYNVKVILYSNNVQAATDTEAVVVNNADSTAGAGGLPASENRGETVEITYPTQAGPWGAFRKPGTNNAYAGVVDVAASTGSNNIRAYYTTTAPGNDPTWVRCSSPEAGETLANSADGVRCTLASGVNPTSVTAIAAATGDANQSFPADCQPPGATGSPCGEGEDSGDAHRAFGYVQVPGTVTLAPATQRVDDDAAVADTQYPCTSNITVTVLDQAARKVAGANVDVHAAGPTDSLYFSTTPAGSHQPPDRNNHATENSVNCESTTYPRPFNTTSGQGQGEHEVPGEGDIKHIETTATGTNDAGSFVFKLNNRTATPTPVSGVTQITAYYDRDDDDALCAQEPQVDGSVGWGTDAGTPTGTADETATCVEPTPTPTGSSSASPSSSSTARPSNTATGSASPSGSATPGSSRSITLVADKDKVNSGASVTLSGSIVSSNSSCEDNEFVRINRRVHGTTSFEPLTSANTNADGSYSVTVVAQASADYQAVATAHDNCAETTSSEATVLAKVAVSIRVSEFRPSRGDRIQITGKVTPNHSGTKVTLQRKKGGSWVKVARDGLNDRSAYKFVVTADWRSDRLFRVRWVSSDSDHETGTSQKVKITVRAS